MSVCLDMSWGSLGLRNFLAKILQCQKFGFKSSSLSLAFTLTLKGTNQSTLLIIFPHFIFAPYVVNNGVVWTFWITTSKKINVQVSFETWKFAACSVDAFVYLHRPSLAAWVLPHCGPIVLLFVRGSSWMFVQRVKCVNILPLRTTKSGIWRTDLMWINSILRYSPRQNGNFSIGCCIPRLRGLSRVAQCQEVQVFQFL